MEDIEKSGRVLLYYGGLIIFITTVLLFLVLRSMEIISMCSSSPVEALKLLIIFVSFSVLLFFPPRTNSVLFRRLGVLLILLYTIKVQMDYNLAQRLPPLKNRSKSVAIVTGGNTGIGLAVTRKLLAQNVTVVMSCLTSEACQATYEQISPDFPHSRLVPMQMDLADLASIRNFVDTFRYSFQRLDYLVNNAGLLASPGELTRQGLEMSFGVMHLGHFALTKWLSDLLNRPIEGVEEAARVVAISSSAYLFGDFHKSLFFSEGLEVGDLAGELTENCGEMGTMGMLPLWRCPLTNGYARAKLANVLHMHQLQLYLDAAALTAVKRRQAVRRVVTSSLHPGSVSTAFHPFFHQAGTMMLRSAEEAADVVMFALFSDDFLPGAFIDAMQRPHDLQGFQKLHAAVHLKAFPSATSLPVFQGRNTTSRKPFSFDEYMWGPSKHAMGAPVAKSILAKRLWEVSESLISSWEHDANFYVTQQKYFKMDW